MKHIFLILAMTLLPSILQADEVKTKNYFGTFFHCYVEVWIVNQNGEVIGSYLAEDFAGGFRGHCPFIL